MWEERSRIAGGGASADVDADVEADKLDAWYRYSVGESYVVWMRRSAGLSWCHWSDLIGACCIRIIRGRKLRRSHIHTVLGVESSLVAHRVPSLLNARMLIPCFMRLVSFFSSGALGGVIGCGVTVYVLFPCPSTFSENTGAPGTSMTAV